MIETSNAYPARDRTDLAPVPVIGTAVVLPLTLLLGLDLPSAVCLGANFVLAFLAWQRVRPAAICGYFVFAMFLTGTAVGGFILSDTITTNSGTALSLLRLTPSEHQATVVLLVTASNAILGGGLLTSILLQSRGLEPYGIRESTSTLFAKLSAVVLGVAGLNLLFALSLNGFNAYISRDDYHLGSSSGLAGLPDLIAIASVVVLGALLVSSKKNLQRVIAIALLLTYWLYFFSLATRAFALTPLLIALGMACVTRAKWLPWLLAAMAVISVSLLELPLYLRGLNHHGLIPYAEALNQFPSFRSNPLVTASNFLGGFHIVGATAFSEPPINMDAFWISVTPQSGSSAGWYEVSDTLRLGPAMPYGAVGEVGNHGLVFTIVFFFVIGGILGLLHWMTILIVERYRNPLAAIVIVGLQFNMAILATQYNLRSGMRTLYYAIAVALVVLMMGKISARRAGRSRNASDRPEVAPVPSVLRGRDVHSARHQHPRSEMPS